MTLKTPRPHWTTTSAFVREILAFDIRFTREERQALVARAKADIARIEPILAARERDQLLKMPCSKTIH